MTENRSANNLVGVESEVRVFFLEGVGEELKEKAACMLLGALGEIYGNEEAGENKTCSHTEITCLGQEFLPNGSRAYLDHGYLEISTPACIMTSDAVAAVRAGDLMIQKAAVRLQQSINKKVSVVAVRNNIDQRGHSYGAHVNIRMTRKGYDSIFSDSNVLNDFVIPFFVTLPLICGSGRCSSEDDEDLFQIWQRSDFLQELVGLQTTYDRPLVNTRNESLAEDTESYARFHIIAFDANRMEVAEFLKLGLLRLLCAAIDAESLDVALELDDPIKAIRSLSRKPFDPLVLESKKNMSPLGIQRIFFDSFRSLHKKNVFTGRVPDAADILSRWEQTLSQLEKDPFCLVGNLDWITKYAWLEQIRRTRKLKWSSPQMKWLDILYLCLTGENTPDLPCERITNDRQINKLVTFAPPSTRDGVRGELLRKFGKEIGSANWHYIVDSDGLNAYLLPDDPKPGSVRKIKETGTLKKAASSLGLYSFQLDDSEEPEAGDGEASEDDRKITAIN